VCRRQCYISDVLSSPLKVGDWRTASGPPLCQKIFFVTVFARTGRHYMAKRKKHAATSRASRKKPSTPKRRSAAKRRTTTKRQTSAKRRSVPKRRPIARTASAAKRRPPRKRAPTPVPQQETIPEGTQGGSPPPEDIIATDEER
jgi:hypothetical protein